MKTSYQIIIHKNFATSTTTICWRTITLVPTWIKSSTMVRNPSCASPNRTWLICLLCIPIWILKIVTNISLFKEEIIIVSNNYDCCNHSHAAGVGWNLVSEIRMPRMSDYVEGRRMSVLGKLMDDVVTDQGPGPTLKDYQ